VIVSVGNENLVSVVASRHCSFGFFLRTGSDSGTSLSLVTGRCVVVVIVDQFFYEAETSSVA
jgi:hypothetical protein